MLRNGYRLVVFEPSWLANKLLTRLIMFRRPVTPSSTIPNLHCQAIGNPVIVISLFSDSPVTSYFITPTDINYAIRNSENV